MVEFGYFFEWKFFSLLKYFDELDWIIDLKECIEEILFYVNLENEVICREMMIVLIILDLIYYF